MVNLELIKTVSLLLASVVFFTYVLYIHERYGTQKSISISVYNLPKNYRYVFRIYIWLLSSAIIIASIGFDNKSFLYSGVLLSLVGSFCDIKDTIWKYIIHMVGAVSGIAVAYLGLFMMDLKLGIIFSSLTVFETIIAYIFLDRKHIIWNIEIICFVNLISGIYYLIN